MRLQAHCVPHTSPVTSLRLWSFQTCTLVKARPFSGIASLSLHMGLWRQGKDAVAKIKQSSGNDQVFLEVADVSDLASLRALADRYGSSGLPLHVLVNSAGIMVPPPPSPLPPPCGPRLSFPAHSAGPAPLHSLCLIKTFNPAKLFGPAYFDGHSACRPLE